MNPNESELLQRTQLPGQKTRGLQGIAHNWK